MLSRGAAFGAAAVVFLLDRASKMLIRGALSTWETIPVIPGVFNLVHTENRGAAFGLLASAPDGWRNLVLVGLSAAVLALVAGALWQLPRAGGNLLQQASLSLILGGAMGNLFDRLAYGRVTDFLQVFLGTYEWPAFNLADSAISVGAGLLLLDMLRGRRAAPSH